MALTEVNSKGIKDADIATGDIADDAVTSAKIADDAIVAAGIADNAVVTDAINADAVTGAKIADDAIDSEHYADGSIDTAHIADDAVTADKLANAINTDIAAKAVLTGSTNNNVCTVTGANAITGEANVHVVSGKLLIGTDTVQTLPYTSSGAIQTVGAYNTSSINIVNNENSANTSALTFNKIRGASGSAGGTDVMGSLNWGAYDGAAWRSGITVEGKLTSIASNDVPSKLAFKINSGSSLTERCAITEYGITFNGDTAEANAINDYEEGTFTPSWVSVTNNSSYEVWTYTKIGRQVTIMGSLVITSVTGATGDSVYIGTGGLPFTSMQNPTNSLAQTVGPVMSHHVAVGKGNLHSFVGNNSTALEILANGTNTGWDNIKGSDVTANDQLKVTHTYFVA